MNKKLLFFSIVIIFHIFTQEQQKQLVNIEISENNSKINNLDIWLVKDQINITSNIQTIALTLDETLIAIAASNTIYIYSFDCQLIKIIENAHTGNVLDLKFTHDNLYLASTGTDKKIKIWDVNLNYECIKVFGPHSNICPTIDFLPEKYLLASGYTNGEIKLYNLTTLEVVHTISTHRPINSISFSCDKKSLTAGINISSENSEKLIIFDLKNENAPKKNCYGYEDWFISSVRYSSLTDLMGYIRTFPNLENSNIYNACSQFVFTLIDFNNHEPIQIVKTINDSDLSQTFDFFSTDTFIAGYNNGNLKIWKLDREQPLLSWQAHTDKITKVLYLPINKLIASASQDGTIKLWQKNDRNQVSGG